MWLFTEVGFFSAVRKQSDLDSIKVRARVGEDLENFVDKYCGGDLEIIETPHRDYPYRVFMDKATFANVLLKLALDINYTNFKNHVKHVEGVDRASLYSKVWNVMILTNKNGRLLPPPMAPAKDGGIKAHIERVCPSRTRKK